MAQVCIYLDDDTMDLVRKNAAIRGVSLSKYISEVLQHTREPGWPSGYWELFGSIDDDTFAAPGELPFEADAPRGAL